jgi:hypothetical protein
VRADHETLSTIGEVGIVIQLTTKIQVEVGDYVKVLIVVDGISLENGVKDSLITGGGAGFATKVVGSSVLSVATLTKENILVAKFGEVA